MTQSVSNIAFVAAYHEAKKVSQYGNSQTSKFSNYRLGVTSMIGTRWLAALSFEIPSSHGRAQNVRSNTALSFAAFQRPSAQWGGTSKKTQNVIDDRSLRLASGNYAACGFQIFLQRKHQPLIYQVNSARKRKKELNLKNYISDLHPLLPLCICVLDQFCDWPKGWSLSFSGGVSKGDKKGTTGTCFSLSP